MDISETVKTSLNGLRTNKLRSLLTMLGVIIGVIAVVLLISLSISVRKTITGQIKSLGSNLVMVVPGNMDKLGALGGSARSLINKLELKHATKIQNTTSFDVVVSPAFANPGSVKYGPTVRNTTIITGTDHLYNIARDWKIDEGNWFRKTDMSASRKVCVIGKSVEKDLFKYTNPIGKHILINGTKFKIIGTMESKGQALDIDRDDHIWAPVSAIQKLFGVNKISLIFIRVPDAKNIPLVMKETKMILLKYMDPDDFTVKAQGDTLNTFETVSYILTAMLGCVAGISLVVGGIGIMNIMIVSVTERTREIGLRKAVGAKDIDILLQFLNESIIISILGGMFGVFFCYIVSYLVMLFFPKFDITIAPKAIGLAMFFSALVGVFFGVYPAYKASKLSPIEALRYE